VERIRIELTDYVVDSLRAMPEHRSLVTNWSALARAIHEGGEGIHESGVGKDDAKEADRIVTAKMQVLIRILSRSAQAEVSSVAPEFLTQDVDRDVADIISADLDAKTSKPKSGKGGKPSTSHEVLSVALLKALPELLAKFKSDPRILESITRLPRLLIPSVISLPQRKNDFNDLLKNLAEIFLSSGDDIVLKNISRSLAFLSNGDHVRAKDVRFQFQQLCQKLRQRTLELLDDDGAADDQAASKKKQKSPKKKKRRSIVADEGSEEGDDTAKEFTLALFLKRISILSNIVDLRELLEVDGDTAAEGMFDSMRDGIIGGISSRLSARQVVENEEGKDIRSKEIWRKGDRNLHSCFTDSVKSALRFLLTSFAWRLLEAQGEDPILIAGLDLDLEKRQEDDSDDEMNIHSLVQQRDQLVDFILLCFRPLVPVDRVEEYSDDQILASESIQTAACHAACDLRMLLPKEWAEAKSPLLRAVALLDDQPLVFGCVRFFKTKETDLRDIELDNFDDIEKVCDLLLPLGRVFVSDWSSSNRREAGYVIAHIVGSGQASNQLVTILSRIVKKIDPLHLLETHMASLRCSFDDWLMSEPEELASDRPTDKEMAAFEEAENAYKERFELLVHQASRFSQSLGVGKVDPQLENPLLGFVKEGVRYAFSTDMSNGEDPLMPGGRLTFLALIGKYLHWVKRHKSFREVIVDNFLEREEDLRDDPEFDQVHADDIEALEAFRKLIGVKDTNVSHSKSPRSIADSQFSEGEEEESFEDTSLRGKSPASANAQNKRTRLSRDSSIGSGSINRSRSRTLSPLPEEDTDTVDDEEGESPSKRRKMNKGARKSSVGSALTMTTLDKGLNSTIEEEDESDASDTY
jgi:cohesin complex subunit SA-1/2